MPGVPQKVLEVLREVTRVFGIVGLLMEMPGVMWKDCRLPRRRHLPAAGAEYVATLLASSGVSGRSSVKFYLRKTHQSSA